MILKLNPVIFLIIEFINDVLRNKSIQSLMWITSRNRNQLKDRKWSIDQIELNLTNTEWKLIDRNTWERKWLMNIEKHKYLQIEVRMRNWKHNLTRIQSTSIHRITILSWMQKHSQSVIIKAILWMMNTNRKKGIFERWIINWN